MTRLQGKFIIILLLIIVGQNFLALIPQSNFTPTASNEKIYSIIHQSTRWELKSLHLQHELDKCQGKGDYNAR